MKAKRVMALVLSAVLTVGSLDTAYLPVLAAGEEQTVTAAEDDDAVSADEAVSQDETEDEAASDEQKETYEADKAGEKEADEASKEAADDEDDSSETADDTAGVDISEYLTVNDKGEITNYSYEGEDITDLIIPSAVKGITVKKIGNDVFKDHAEIISVQFPSTLESIGDHAFAGASMGSNQRDGKLVIPANVNYIGLGAFSGCRALYELTFEDGSTTIEFGESWGSGDTFNSCSALTNINFSNRISVIPPTFANGCASLTTVNWSPTIKSIGKSAFADDVVLDSPDLSGTVLETIGDSAFAGCTGFGLVKFPETIKSIGESAFAKTLMGKRSAAGHLVIPASVDYIGIKAFEGCYYLESVTFNGGLGGSDTTSIRFDESWGQGGTFSECKALKTITFSDKIAVLPDTFAEKCTALTTVNWGSTIKEIGKSAFADCEKLNSPDFSSTKLESIGEKAFVNCSSLDVVKFPETIKYIGNCAFENTPMGTKEKKGNLVIPNSIETIEYRAFHNCEFLESVTFKDYTGPVALDPIKFTTNWAEGALTFSDCKSLKSIDTSNRIGDIPSTFASGCEALKSVKWGKNVTTIGDRAFMGDVLLNSPDFSATTLKSISEKAFLDCKEMGCVTFPRSLKFIGLSAFENTAMGTKTNKGYLVISEEVSEIGARAFCGCAYLGRVKIEDYTGDGILPVLKFGRNWTEVHTFADCPMLEEIVFSDRVATIPEKFAINCKVLTNLTIPDGVENIEQGAFYVEMDNGKLLKTDVTGESDVVKNYDWAKDNRERGKVVKISVTGVTLDRSELELSVGRSATLKATVNPSDATNKSVFWGSSDTNVASVENGKVKALAAGEAVITVTTTDGGFKATCKVTVVEGSSPIGDGEEITLPGKKKVPVTAYVTFITNGGDEQDSYYTLNKKGNKASLHKLVRKGYTFKGWYCSYKDKKGKDKTKKISALTATTLTKYAVDGELVLKAEFNANKYTVKYYKTAKLDGKKVKMKGKAKSWKGAYSLDNETVQNVTIADGSTITAKDTTLELIGWTRVKYGTEAEFETGDSVSLEDLIPDKGKTVKLYPVFVNKQ